MKTLMLVLVYLILFASPEHLHAQSETGANQFLNDANGRPLYLKSSYTPDGSPFLFDDYYEAALLAANGRLYTNVRVKLNVVDNELYYQLPDGKEMVATTPIKKIYLLKVPQSNIIVDTLTITAGALPVNVNGAMIFISHVEGKLPLLERVQVSFKDMQQYGNTNIVRTFTRKTAMMFADGKGIIQKLPKAEHEILALMNDKNRQIQKFMESQKLNLRKDQDLINLFRYYNEVSND